MPTSCFPRPISNVAEVASRLGWYDQAHLTRDYTKLTGTPPVRLRQERREGR
ncbi:transcriptional regulator, AraC family [Mycobacteroides abscessus subsp. abscessus]|nr:hypothetical protein [Mycobacteroides abscessus]SHU13324.1 transcriptional regulator, AraC family [Mycobacteroides abscessus subsp. abscessus]CPT98377.1 Putative AraC-family transcriptional regulator [Mycobacteroides abscessus]CPZ45594.1 Putative AraC-family transcriptional regulator [Mycobacteroides abscessus]CPZ84786.1 Putative AraC-family transcriptional regulator [Mycobacteroides abscessus]